MSTVDQSTILFKSDTHKVRFVTGMQSIGKIYDGKYDPEYGAALYILTADLDTWNGVRGYITNRGIDFGGILSEIDLSGGYAVLIKLAGNLFNMTQSINPIEFMRLDDVNFELAMSAIKLRRNGLQVESEE